MSSNNRVFEETLKVEYIDKDLKVFDKVQRIEGETKDSKYYISMDVNSEIYPMKKDALYQLLLARLIYESKTTPTNFEYDLIANSKNTLMDNFDYVMSGKVFQFSLDKKKKDNNNNDTLSISISFGELLFQFSRLKKDDKTGKPKGFEDINIDGVLYLLIKKEFKIDEYINLIIIIF